MRLDELHDLIACLAPIEGINSDGAIWFTPEATEQQKAAAQEAMVAHLSDLEPHAL
jgi:hypothetical protein